MKKRWLLVIVLIAVGFGCMFIAARNVIEAAKPVLNMGDK